MTATLVRRRELRKIELRFVTLEAELLELFGGQASEAMAGLLEKAGIELFAEHYPSAVVDGGLAVMPGDGVIPADRVVSLPRLRGPQIGGLPVDADGFIPVDLHQRVRDLEGVFAAGDATDFAVKQGGIASQQADAAAEAIAALAGASVEPRPFRPVLRGLLLTGETLASCARRSPAGAARTGRSPSRLCGGRRRRSRPLPVAIPGSPSRRVREAHRGRPGGGLPGAGGAAGP